MAETPDSPTDNTGYNPERGSYETRFEHPDESLYEIVRAVAAVVGSEPTGLSPIADVVDPDGVRDVLRRPTDKGERAADLAVSFTYEGCQVTVTRMGVITVTPPDTDAETGGS